MQIYISTFHQKVPTTKNPVKNITKISNRLMFNYVRTYILPLPY